METDGPVQRARSWVRRYRQLMALAADDDAAGGGDGDEFVIEDLTTGIHASGFGLVGDGRSFSFHVDRQILTVEIYRPRLTGPVPQADDVVATATRSLVAVDLTDERSLTAAVRDAVADAQPVNRRSR